VSTDKSEEYRQRTEQFPPFAMRITSYRISGKFHCTVDNLDPGAVIARSEGETREEAESKAVARARARLEYSLASLKMRDESA